MSFINFDLEVKLCFNEKSSIIGRFNNNSKYIQKLSRMLHGKFIIKKGEIELITA